MISLEYAKRTDRLMRATTSLTVAEFEARARRVVAVRLALRTEKTVTGPVGQRHAGGGRKGCLVSSEQKSFLILTN